jgi:PDDEXK-like domain of unknown function (DUF3799)
MNILASEYVAGNPDAIEYTPVGVPMFAWVSGLVIDITCAVTDAPMAWYHGQPCAGPSISSSQLRTIFNESLAHYWDMSPLNPDRQEFKQTEQVIIGRAAHHLMLGEGDFAKHFIVRPDEAPDGRPWNGNNKSCREWLAQREVEGLTVLKQEWVEQIKGMSAMMVREQAIMDGILSGMVELSMFYKDSETGIWVKSRPDSVPNDNDASDLKCVSDVSSDGIERSLGERGYHAQAACVDQAMREVFGRGLECFFLIYVEQKRPHSVRIDPIHPDEIAAGVQENRAALHLFKRALETNYWPGPKNDFGDGGFIRRTQWARTRAEKRLAQIKQELGI